MKEGVSLSLKALVLFSEGRNQEAYECLLMELASEPESIIILRNIGVILMRLCRYGEAVDYFDKCLRRTYGLGVNEVFEICHQKTIAYFKAKGYAEADSGWSDESGKRCLIKPGSKQEFLYKGIFYRMLGEKAKREEKPKAVGYFNEAIKCLDWILSIDPEYKNAWYEKSLTIMSRARPRFPAGRELAELSEAARRYNSCISREIEGLLEEIPMWASKGALRNILSNCDKALVLYSEKVSFDKDGDGEHDNSKKIEILIYKAYYLLGEEKFYEAIQLCDEALNDLNPRKIDRAYLLDIKGQAFYRLSKYDDSKKYFDMALENNPKEACFSKNKSLILFLRGDRRSSEEYVYEALELDPNLVDALQIKAACLIDSGRKSQAEALFFKCDSLGAKQKSLVSKQNSLIERGDLYFAAEFFGEAQKCFEAAAQTEIGRCHHVYIDKRLEKLKEFQRERMVTDVMSESRKREASAFVRAHCRRGSYRGAIELCGDMLSSNPESGWDVKSWLERMIRTLSLVINTWPNELQDWGDKGLGFYLRFRIGASNQHQVWEDRGDAKRLLGRYEEAIQDFDEAIRLNPQSDFAFGYRGSAKRMLRRYEEAIEDLNVAIRLNPNNAFFATKHLLLAREEFERAKEESKKSQAIASSSIGLKKSDVPQENPTPSAPVLTGYSFSRPSASVSTDYSSPKTVSSKTMNSKVARSLARNFALVGAHCRNGGYRKAIELCGDMLSSNPEGVWDATISLERMLETLNLVINTWPNELQDWGDSGLRVYFEFRIGTSNQYRAWEDRGAVKYWLGHYEEAIQDFDEAIRLNPQSDFAFRRRGDAKRMLDRYEEAIQDFDKAIRLNPKNNFALGRRGDAKRMLRRYEEAIEDLNEAIRLKPKDAFATKHLALAREEFEKTKEEPKKSQAVSISNIRLKKTEIPQETPTPSAPILTGYSFPRPSAPVLTDYSSPIVVPSEPENPAVPVSSVSMVGRYSPGTCLQDDKKLPQIRSFGVDVLAISRRNVSVSARMLGAGFFGQVHHGQWQRGDGECMDVAVKQLKLDVLSEMDRESFKREVETQASINSSAVVKMHGVTLPDEAFSYSLIMEYMDRGNLYDMLHEVPREGLGWDVRTQIAVDVATALVYLHGQNPMIIHGDVKSLNILLNSDGYTKITDFGLATLKRQQSSRSYASSGGQNDTGRGSLLWMAPEQFRMNAKRGPEWDMYSFGIVLWEVGLHEDPYSCAQGNEALIIQYKRENQREEYDERAAGVPREYQFVSEQCWDNDPKKRLTAKQALAKLQEAEVYRRNGGVRLMFPPRKHVERKESSTPSVYTSLGK